MLYYGFPQSMASYLANNVFLPIVKVVKFLGDPLVVFGICGKTGGPIVATLSPVLKFSIVQLPNHYLLGSKPQLSKRKKGGSLTAPCIHGKWGVIIPDLSIFIATYDTGL